MCGANLAIGGSGHRKDGTPRSLYVCQRMHLSRSLLHLDQVVIAVVEGVVSAPTARGGMTRDPVTAWRSLSIEHKREFVQSVMAISIGRVGKGRWHRITDAVTVSPLSCPQPVDAAVEGAA